MGTAGSHFRISAMHGAFCRSSFGVQLTDCVWEKRGPKTSDTRSMHVLAVSAALVMASELFSCQR